MTLPDFTLPENQHPMLRLFPLMPTEELNKLADDIKKNGLRDPVVYVDDGTPILIDGQNRAAACKIANVEINHNKAESWNRWNHRTEEDIHNFILSKNIHRRNLTATQRGKIVIDAEELLPKLRQEAAERQKAALAQANAERKAIAAAKKVVADNPELADEFASKAPVTPEIADAIDPTDSTETEDDAAGTVLNQPPEQPSKPPKPSTPKRTRDALAKLANVGPTTISKLISIRKYTPEFYEVVGTAAGISVEKAAERAAERAAEIAAENARQTAKAAKAAKAEKDKVRQKKNPQSRENGIYKPGAILLGRIKYWTVSASPQIYMPVLLKVVFVKKVFAICESDYFNSKRLEVRMEGDRETHPGSNLEIIGPASETDIAAVKSIWNTVQDLKLIWNKAIGQ